MDGSKEPHLRCKPTVNNLRSKGSKVAEKGTSEKLEMVKATAIKFLGPTHVNMLCNQPAYQRLRQAALEAPPSLAVQLFEIADEAELAMLYYATDVQKSFAHAQKHCYNYSRMEEKRLLAFEPAIREYNDNHDPKDRRMEASFKHAVELARETAQLYLVKD